MKKHAWILLALILLPLQVSSQSFNARFSSTFYSWERYSSESQSEQHLRVYQTAALTIGKLANNKLSFHMYGIASQDLAESADDDPISRLYNAYFQWRERKGIVKNIKLGRQRIYSGVAYGSIDGVDADFRVGKLFHVGGFAGILAPISNQVEAGSWDDGHTFGVRAGAKDLLGTKILLSFMQRNHMPVSYTSPGRYSQKIVEFESLEQRLVGLDVHRKFSNKISSYGRLDYDMKQERVRRAQLELKYAATDKIELTGEFYHRAPFIEANSIFAVFEQNTNQDIGLRASYRYRPNIYITGNLGYQMYDGDETLRFGLGFRNKYGMVGYNFRKGYGGQNNGLYASFNYPLTAKLGILASTGYSRYSLFDEDAEINTSLTGSIGVNYRPNKMFSVDALGQGVSNHFLDSDLRLMLKASYWFFK